MGQYFDWEYLWGRQRTWYSVYPVSALGADLYKDESLCLHLPQGEQADILVQQLVETLDALVGCQAGKTSEERHNTMPKAESPDLNWLREAVRDLQTLLDAPQPDNAVWLAAYRLRMEAIADVWVTGKGTPTTDMDDKDGA